MNAIPRRRRRWLAALAGWLVLLTAAGPVPTRAQDVAPASIDTTPPTQVTGDDAPPPALDPQDQAEPGDADQADGATFNEQVGGGGGKNVVKLTNRVDGRLRMRGNAQLSRIHSPTVGPVNLAYALSSCRYCSTFAVAIQIAAYRQGAPRVTPQNAAIALNVGCSHCVTVALAYQYAIGLDDPDALPDRVEALVRRMDRELRGIQADSDHLTPAEVETRLDGVVAEYQDLEAYLNKLRDERDDDSDGPSPTPTGTLLVPSLGAAEPTPTPTATPPSSTTGAPTSADQSTLTPQPTATNQAATATTTPVPTTTGP